MFWATVELSPPKIWPLLLPRVADTVTAFCSVIDFPALISKLAEPTPLRFTVLLKVTLPPVTLSWAPPSVRRNRIRYARYSPGR